MSTGKASAKLCTNQLLTSSYVDTATIGSYSISEESVATLDVTYTTGAAETNNSMEFRLLFSYNGEDWVSETYSALASGVNTLAPMSHTIAGASAATAYTVQYVVPFCSRNFKVQIKESGVSANYGTASIVVTVAAASGQERNAQQITVGAVVGGATSANQLLEIADLDAITATLGSKTDAKNSATDATSVSTVSVLKEISYMGQVGNSLVPDKYDYIALTYTGSNLTGVVFKTGGAGGSTVSTLTLAYTGSVLDSVTKT